MSPLESPSLLKMLTSELYQELIYIYQDHEALGHCFDGIQSLLEAELEALGKSEDDLVNLREVEIEKLSLNIKTVAQLFFENKLMEATSTKMLHDVTF